MNSGFFLYRMEKKKKTNWFKVEIRLDIRIEEGYNTNILIRFER